jgi:predicted transcriptional regulator
MLCAAGKVQYAAKILDGEKTVELRRRFPDSGSVGATLFIYSSSPIRASSLQGLWRARMG